MSNRESPTAGEHGRLLPGLYAARVRAGMEIADLSEASGAGRPLVGSCELGKYHARSWLIDKLAAALGVSAEVLLEPPGENAPEGVDPAGYRNKMPTRVPGGLEQTPGTAGARYLPGLYSARLAANLEIDELVEDAGVSAAAISCYERGERRAMPEQMRLLAKALGVDAESLCEEPEPGSGFREPMHPKNSLAEYRQGQRDNEDRLSLPALRFYRQEASLTQEALLGAAGINGHNSLISTIEKGKPTPRIRAEALAAALGVTVSDLQVGSMDESVEREFRCGCGKAIAREYSEGAEVKGGYQEAEASEAPENKNSEAENGHSGGTKDESGGLGPADIANLLRYLRDTAMERSRERGRGGSYEEELAAVVDRMLWNASDYE